MRIEFDRDACQGHNRCYLLAPELFEVFTRGAFANAAKAPTRFKLKHEHGGHTGKPTDSQGCAARQIESSARNVRISPRESTCQRLVLAIRSPYE